VHSNSFTQRIPCISLQRAECRISFQNGSQLNQQHKFCPSVNSNSDKNFVNHHQAFPFKFYLIQNYISHSIPHHMFERGTETQITVPHKYSSMFISCLYQLIKFCSNSQIKSCVLNDKTHTGGIFCHVTKAYDCVNCDILQLKVIFYGIQGKARQWFKHTLLEENTEQTINLLIQIITHTQTGLS
jgi:hypothetical protein